ncbi:uncharacterized protein TNCV_2266721 [Trichonephila clavipes]|nr:uncharacterized protein TNCV_2266721 [Trichonephila clavipes]
MPSLGGYRPYGLASILTGLESIEYVWDMLDRRIVARQPPPTCNSTGTSVGIACIHGLLYHNHGSQKRLRERPPKHNTATTGLCMAYCTLREQLFAWKMTYPDMTIRVMNDKP